MLSIALAFKHCVSSIRVKLSMMFTVMDHLAQARFKSLKVAKCCKAVSSTPKHTRFVVNKVNIQKHQYDPLNIQKKVLGTKHFVILACLSHTLLRMSLHSTYLTICLPLLMALQPATHYSVLLSRSVNSVSFVT